MASVSPHPPPQQGATAPRPAPTPEQRAMWQMRNQLLQERQRRAQLEHQVKYQQAELHRKAHPPTTLTSAGAPVKKQSKSKITRKFTFQVVISQVAPQADGLIHVTAGYRLSGFVVLKVKQEEHPFYMSALCLSLEMTEDVFAGDGDAGTRTKTLNASYFPVADHFAEEPNQPSNRGYFSWAKGVYRFPFVIATAGHYLPSFEFQGTYGEFAYRSYALRIHYRKSVSDNEPFQMVHATPIVLHQFRKIPQVVAYSQKQSPSTTKTSKFLLRRGLVHSSITLLEQKTVYFLNYHTIPFRFEIDNQSGFRIHDVSVRLCQELFYRTRSTGRAMLMCSQIAWERDMGEALDLPLGKGVLRAVEKVVIPLTSTSLCPTSTKEQKSFFYFRHAIELVIRTPKDVADIVVRLPLTCVEPPIEHLAQAIYNRAMARKQQAAQQPTTPEQQGGQPRPVCPPQLAAPPAEEASTSSEEEEGQECTPLVVNQQAVQNSPPLSPKQMEY